MKAMIDEDLLLSSYDYVLPKNYIATEPTRPKEKAKLLVYKKNEDAITHAEFENLSEILPDCAIVFNDTKVIKARIFGQKYNGTRCELFFHKALNEYECLAQIKGRVKVGDILSFEAKLKAEILALNDDGTRKVAFTQNDKKVHTKELFALLEKIGHIPLPPYIKRADTKQDISDYQSIMAKNEGAVAAPTASLHFSHSMLEKLAKKHEIYTLTLHVGAGTFQGVETEDIRQHTMHEEYFCVNDEIAKLIHSKKQILGIGTTSTRCIEYVARTGLLQGQCDLFLHPQNKPLRQNYLLTNFHLPKSTLIMLVASFIGRGKTLELYQEAMKKGYKFYSYGDAMLII